VNVRNVTRNITKHLMLDYTNIKDPIVTKDYLETYNKGEISYHGMGGTPFFPSDLHDPTPYPTNQMGYLVASDYVANSMLYQSFVNNLLKYRVSADDTPDLASYLKTSCDGDILMGDMCLGTLIPQIQQAYPDSVAEVYLEATRVAPAVFFQQDGMVRVQGPLQVTLNAKKGNVRNLMAVADVDVTARIKLYVEKQKIKGNVTIDKVDVKMKQNNIKGFDDNAVKELTGSTKAMMDVMGNTYLRKGLPIPLVKGVQLTNTKVNVYDRTIRIDSDCQVDQATLSKMAAKAIKDNGEGVRVEGIDDSGNTKK